MKPTNKTYQLYCQFCHYKKTFDGDDSKSLSLSKSSDIQAGIPRYDSENKAIEQPPMKRGKPKSKCPNCGRMIFVTRYNEPKQDKPS
jgi:DNA-directed RNA polymerase subunit M/transcription elongation factor TFIIS